jgi:hypothetical protein
MKTVSIELGKKPSEVRRVIERNKISQGDRIVVLAKKEETSVTLLFFLIVVAMALVSALRQRTNGLTSGVDSIQEMDNEALLKLDSPAAVEKAIESNLGVKLEVAIQEEVSDPIDGLFGKWKGSNITLASIRKKAWERI